MPKLTKTRLKLLLGAGYVLLAIAGLLMWNNFLDAHNAAHAKALAEKAEAAVSAANRPAFAASATPAK